MESVKYIKLDGNTSGIPPTLVDTTCKLMGKVRKHQKLSCCGTTYPQDAASTIAMQYASVKDVLRKM